MPKERLGEACVLSHGVTFEIVLQDYCVYGKTHYGLIGAIIQQLPTPNTGDIRQAIWNIKRAKS